jgi:hypothetical protein
MKTLFRSLLYSASWVWAMINSSMSVCANFFGLIRFRFSASGRKCPLSSGRRPKHTAYASQCMFSRGRCRNFIPKYKTLLSTPWIFTDRRRHLNDTPKPEVLCRPSNLISGRADSEVIRACILPFRKRKIRNARSLRRGENPPRGLRQRDQGSARHRLII